MRTFHRKRNLDFTPTVNVDRLWSFIPEDVQSQVKGSSESAPLIDVTKLGYFKVLGKGHLPDTPIVVKAKYFSKEVRYLHLLSMSKVIVMIIGGEKNQSHWRSCASDGIGLRSLVI